MPIIDEELKSLALHALKEVYYEQHSYLVNRVVELAEGLDTDCLKMMLQDSNSVYSVSEDAEGDYLPSLWVKRGGGVWDTVGCVSIMEAFQVERATEIYLVGRRVFTLDEAGEWFWVGDEGES